MGLCKTSLTWGADKCRPGVFRHRHTLCSAKAKHGERLFQKHPRTAGICLLSLATSVSVLFGPADGVRAAYSQGQTLFLEAWRALDKAYVDKSFNGQQWFRTRERFLKNEAMGSSEQAYSAIRNLIATLNDPFTRLLDPTEYELVLQQQERAAEEQRASVGVELTLNENGDVVVVSSAQDSPAENNGLSPGDVFESANGVGLKGKSLYQAANLLQGAPSTSVNVQVRKASSGQLQTVELQRQLLSRKTVSSTLCTTSVGYIRVSRFTESSGQASRKQLQQLEQNGARAYVLDLRSNPGGSFPEGVEIARSILPSGSVVVNIADSQGIRDIYDVQGTTPVIQIDSKLVVLTDGGTASASEVLAAALRDNNRATLVGKTTFGKGLIQSLIELSDGSALAVTVARYQTPAGSDINQIGIQPDVMVDDIGVLPKDGAEFCKVLDDQTSQGAQQLRGVLGY